MIADLQAPRRLQGRQLLLARGLWLILIITILIVFVASLSAFQQTIETVCAPLPGQTSGSACIGSQLRPAAVEMLNAVGLSLNGYSHYIIWLTVATELIGTIIALLIFWRRSEQIIALFVGLTLVIIPANDPANILGSGLTGWRFPGALVNLAGFILLVLLFYIFPNGRFVPGWTRWMIVLYSLPGAFTVFDSPWMNLNLWPGWLQGAFFFSLVITMVFAQGYRYRYISGPIERQQTKWVVFTLIGGLVWILLFGSLSDIIPSLAEPGSYYILIAPVLNSFPLLLMILVFGIAILRYRLFDIDFIIRRTLVYSMLTALLGLLYFGSVTLLQSLFSNFTGEQSTAALVISTLVIAGLFNPLRLLIQKFIDRRFYRQKYNTDQALTRFAAAARDEVEMDNLIFALIGLVEETMQPEQVSLWLKERTS